MPSQTGFAAIAAIAAIRFPLLSKRTWGRLPPEGVRPSRFIWGRGPKEALARGRGPGRPPGPRGSGRGGGGATVRRASLIVKGRHKLAGEASPPALTGPRGGLEKQELWGLFHQGAHEGQAPHSEGEGHVG